MVSDSQPVAIGAIGGSGTRVVAGLLTELGYFIGHELNQSNDNLSFTRRFKRLEILDLPADEFRRLSREFVAEMEASRREAGAERWGWKEPNTQVVIDRLLEVLPGLKYIHVIRNGLDMAHSTNQNQPRLWGRHFLGGDSRTVISPRYALKYWCAVQRRIVRLASELGEARIHLLNYDDLCRSPVPVIERLAVFLEAGTSEAARMRLAERVAPPASLGRWRAAGLSVFDSADVDYVASLGFDVAE
jgi:hypothetical protein